MISKIYLKSRDKVARLECINRGCRWFGLSSELNLKEIKCPVCNSSSFFVIEPAIKCSRVDHINDLIKVIASHGRCFFKRKGVVAYMEKDRNGKVWLVDEYTKNRIYVAYEGHWFGFSHGGTMKALVERFYAYIKTGKPISVEQLAFEGYRTDGTNIWGYPAESVKPMRRAALTLPCIYEPEEAQI